MGKLSQLNGRLDLINSQVINYLEEISILIYIFNIKNFEINAFFVLMNF